MVYAQMHEAVFGTGPAPIARDARQNMPLPVAGFVGIGFPEHLAAALAERFQEEQQPAGLHLVVVAACGNGKGRGLDQLAAPGMVSKLTYGWAGLSPQLLKQMKEGTVQGWNLPLGVVSHIIRDVAAKRPGPITKIGLGTFVDPREQGGKVTSPDQADRVQLVHVGGEELLWYRAPPRIDVALIRGTTADLDGNVSFEREALFLDSLNQAGCFSLHLQLTTLHRGAGVGAKLGWIAAAVPSQGELRVPFSSIQPLPNNERKVIAHRAMLLIDTPHSIVNLGIGVPEGVATVCTTHAHHNPEALPINLSTEAGSMGGIPTGGLRFGASHNAANNGGGVDVACLGMAEVDCEGNVNVSSFGPRMPGCGGFIDISQTAHKVIFCGAFTSGGLKVGLSQGKLHIHHEGRSRKFVAKVQQKTFSVLTARQRDIYYLTERAVFKLVEGKGIELIEVAPGIDIQRDVLAHMGFKPIIRRVKQMDERVFYP
eukprot:jgi/Astpho2/2912/fgenesh1_pg.00050_%23_154_t